MTRLALATITLATSLLASPARADDACGETELGPEALAAINHAADAENNDKADDPGSAVTYHVPVHLHVVRRAAQGEGDMPVAHARAITLDVVNEQFAAQQIPFRLDLASIDYVEADDATYHLAQNSEQERALFDLAQIPGRRNLNMYLVGSLAGTGVTGWGEFLVNPQLKRAGDHVVLRYYPAKGGFSDPLVPVHEVGHWLGLLHTFQFGCGQTLHGDLIRDTPTQASGHFSCDPTSDSCPDDPGLDPIDNIMGYSHGCRGQFTAGQIRRMKFLYRTARGGKGDDLPVVDPTAPEAGGCRTSGGGGPAALLLVGVALLAIRRRR